MSSTTNGRGRYVALLRGINVGGKHRMPMAELRKTLGAEGLHGVRTYIQSGNIVFESGSSNVANMASKIKARIESTFDLRIPVVIRTAQQFQAVHRGVTRYAQDGDAKSWSVGFLARKPTAERVSSIDHGRSPGDTVTTKGSEIYLHCPNGMARTKYSNAYFDKTLGTTSTFRNMSTIAKIAEMLECA